jgi:hypothetical protein
MNLVAMAICIWNYSYCNVYGTGYQLRYVYHNNDSRIVVEYITGTLNFYKVECYKLVSEPRLTIGDLS